MSDGSTAKSDELLDGIPDHIRSKLIEMKQKVDKIEDIINKMDDPAQLDYLKSTVCLSHSILFFSKILIYA